LLLRWLWLGESGCSKGLLGPAMRLEPESFRLMLSKCCVMRCDGDALRLAVAAHPAPSDFSDVSVSVSM
jgi:hypothetical protein